MLPLTPAERTIADRFNGSNAAPTFAPYKGRRLTDAEIMGVAPAKVHVSPKLARENKGRLDRFVADALATAPATEDPAAYLRRSAAKLDAMIRELDRCGAVPRPLVGVSAFDLAEAREKLSAAALAAADCAVAA